MVQRHEQQIKKRMMWSSSHRILKHMRHVRWEYGISNKEVMRYSVEEMLNVQRKHRRRQYVCRRKEGQALRRDLEIKVEGKKRDERFKKT